jgi:predicted nucleic acid-binding protein
MELLQGIRDKTELAKIKRDMRQWQVAILPITEQITQKAIELVETYHLSHNMEMADALIAATAILNNLALRTGNDKHYKFIPNLNIDVFSP